MKDINYLDLYDNALNTVTVPLDFGTCGNATKAVKIGMSCQHADGLTGAMDLILSPVQFMQLIESCGVRADIRKESDMEIHGVRALLNGGNIIQVDALQHGTGMLVSQDERGLAINGCTPVCRLEMI